MKITIDGAPRRRHDGTYWQHATIELEPGERVYVCQNYATRRVILPTTVRAKRKVYLRDLRPRSPWTFVLSNEACRLAEPGTRWEIQER